MTQKIPLILFSGGADSALLLQWQLHKSNCDVLYIDGNQGPAKIEAEQKARLAVIERLEAGSEYRVSKQIDLRESLKLPTMQRAGFGQLLPWLVGALLSIDPKRHSQLQIGYIMGDDIAENLDKITAAWNSCVKALIGSSWSEEKNAWEDADVPISFPLRYMRKKNVYANLERDVLPLTWSCELPVKKGKKYLPCDKCRACETRKINNPTQKDSE